MSHIMAHATDNDDSLTDGTVLNCEYCGDEVTIIGHKAAVEETWNQEHAHCAVLPATKAIEQLNEELDPGPGNLADIFLNTNRPAWADPDEDRRDENAAFSQWNSARVHLYDPRQGGGPIPSRLSLRLSQLVGNVAPVINVRRQEFDENHTLETFSIIKASVADARKLAAALTFLADLAEGQGTV